MAVDLNLLAVFDVLMAERNVTRTAAKLRLTQPAVSHALGRLRRQLNDQLLSRGPRGMEPTPFALSVAGRLRPLLEELDGMMRPAGGFDPATAQRLFTIGLSDYVAFVLMPGLVERLRVAAPGVRLMVRNASRATGVAMVETGEVELAVGHFPDPPKRLAMTKLFDKGFVCAARRGHPAFAAPLTAEAYAACDHLNVSLNGEESGYIDRVLEQAGIRRRVVVTAGHFLMTPYLLRQSDLVATEPVHLLEPLAEQLDLVLSPPPVPLPTFDISALWRRSNQSDFGLEWLRQQVVSILSKGGA
ncbi:MAG TPA: LysR family transcriptional regulator [Candidatus Sulfotelmatobacter sp.]|jgi:DNA-binding transcriptional LysR family regulator|nr:LysR family transcriptional regulator [Candidatus Sulfotelmatobacter sp.]